MNQYQSNRYSMFRRVNDLLKSESALVDLIPAFKRIAEGLDENVKQMALIDSGKVSATEGKADAKAKVKRNLP